MKCALHFTNTTSTTPVPGLSSQNSDPWSSDQVFNCWSHWQRMLCTVPSDPALTNGLFYSLSTQRRPSFDEIHCDETLHNLSLADLLCTNSRSLAMNCLEIARDLLLVYVPSEHTHPLSSAAPWTPRGPHQPTGPPCGYSSGAWALCSPPWVLLELCSGKWVMLLWLM